MIFNDHEGLSVFQTTTTGSDSVLFAAAAKTHVLQKECSSFDCLVHHKYKIVVLANYFSTVA